LNICRCTLDTLAKRHHHNKGKTWITHRYWHKIKNGAWMLTLGKLILASFSDTKIEFYRMLNLIEILAWIENTSKSGVREDKTSSHQLNNQPLWNSLADTWKGRNVPEQSKGKTSRSVLWRAEASNCFRLYGLGERGSNFPDLFDGNDQLIPKPFILNHW